MPPAPPALRRVAHPVRRRNGLMPRRLPLVLLSIALAVLHTPGAPAQPKGPQSWWPVQPRPLPFVHSLFTDDMVLQRDIPAPVWGWSTPGDSVTVAVDGK